MAGSKHGRGAEQVSLRLPDGLRERLKAVAEGNARSMNAEIIHRLEVSLAGEELGEGPAIATVLDLPDGVTDDDLASALTKANEVAFRQVLKQLGINRRQLPLK